MSYQRYTYHKSAKGSLQHVLKSMNKLTLNEPVMSQEHAILPILNQFYFLFLRNLYRLGTVYSKTFVSKVLLRIKWKFELTVHFKHEMLGKW